MFIRLAELVFVLALLWVLANVIKAMAFKASLGGGFWGLSNWMTSADREAAKEKEVEAEVQRRLAALAAEGKGGVGK